MSIKICIFSALYPPHIGGVERYTEEIALKLHQLGYQVLVVTSRYASTPLEENVDGVRIYRFPVFHFLESRLPVPVPGRFMFTMLKKISAFQADIYITNTRFYPHSLLAGFLANRQKKPVLLIEHGASHPPMPNKLLALLSHGFEHLQTAVLSKLITGFYGVSQASNEWLTHFGIRAKGIFYNGIETHYKVKQPYDIRKKLNLPQGAIIIAFVGRLIENKGILTLIEAYNSLTPRYTNIHLVVAGLGPLSDRVPNSDRFSVLGRLDYDEVMNLLDQTDIFVLPSKQPEGFGRSVIEAGARCCCVIASSLGGTKEIISDSAYGISLQTDTPEELQAALEKVILDENLRVSMAARLRDKVVSQYDWSILAERMSAEIGSILQVKTR